MIETNLVSNIEIINPTCIARVHTYPVNTVGGDTANIIIFLNNISDKCAKSEILLNFKDKKDVEYALREIYHSMQHSQPLFIIQYHRGGYGGPIKSDKALVGGINLADVQNGLNDIAVGTK